MKLGLLVNSQNALGKLLKLEMQVKRAYELRKFILEVDDKLKAYNETRESLIKKYGEEKEGQIRVKDENIEKFIKDINELTAEEIEITVPEISIDDLEGKIDTETLVNLSYLIK